jgi:hypothetical protein
MTQKTTGFASPAQGYEEQTIDLNRLLIRNPPATYFFRLDSSNMEEFGLARGSILIVDGPRNGISYRFSVVPLRQQGTSYLVPLKVFLVQAELNKSGIIHAFAAIRDRRSSHYLRFLLSLK